MDRLIFERLLDAPVEDILENWPGASSVFISNRMSCIGCPFSKFHTLQDACEIYQLDEEVLVGQIQELIEIKE